MFIDADQWVVAQTSAPATNPVASPAHLSTEQDHQRMMDWAPPNSADRDYAYRRHIAFPQHVTGTFPARTGRLC